MSYSKMFKSYILHKGKNKIAELDNVKQLYDIMQNLLDIDKQYVNSMLVQNKTYKGYSIVVRKETAHERYTRKATQKSVEERS